MDVFRHRVLGPSLGRHSRIFPRVGKYYDSRELFPVVLVTSRPTSVPVIGLSHAVSPMKPSGLPRRKACDREARDARLDGVRHGDSAGVAHQDIAALEIGRAS